MKKVKLVRLEVFTLSSRANGYYCRPAGTLGSMGWTPFAWSMAWGATAEEARAAFHKEHQSQGEVG